MDGRQGVIWEDRMSSAPYLSPSGTLAPWAEAVRTDMPLRVDDLAALPDDGWQYELVEGVLIRMPASGYEASNVAARLLARLGVFVEDHALGAVTGADGGYRLDPERPRDTELVPDVAFVRVDRIPLRRSPEYAKALRLAPDLAVEVASPFQTVESLGIKARVYLSFGTQLMWVVWPMREQVDIWRQGAAVPVTLSAGHILDGEDVVPGFSYPVASLFR